MTQPFVRGFVITVLLAVAVLVKPATARSQSAPDSGEAAATVDAVDVVEIEVGDNFFRPKRVKIPAGTTVRWRNDGRDLHNVLPDKGSRFGIDELERDATYAYRFEKPGRYGYYCSLHGAPRTGQFGTIRVTRTDRRGA